MPAGRPSDYNEEIAEEICRQIIYGKSLRKICKMDGMPHKGTVCLWLAKHKEFSEQYAWARSYQTEHMLEEILEISDEGTNDTYEDEDGNAVTKKDVIMRSRLRVDTRKWAMSKLAPKKYGDTTRLEHTGKDGGAIQTEAVSDDKLTRALLVFLAKTGATGIED